MPNSRIFPVALLLALMAVMAGTAPRAAGQESGSEQAGGDWEFAVAPYLVAVNIDGTTEVGRLPGADLDVGTSDILENLRFGFMGRAEALYQNQYGVILDVAYMNLADSSSTPLPSGSVRVGGSQVVLEGFLSYRLFSDSQSFVDLYGGGRYWDIDLNVDVYPAIGSSTKADSGDDWVDPVIGLRGSHYLNENWSLTGRADIGGLGVGSDFSWNLQAGVGYDFNKTWSTHLQYKALAVDYDNGNSGTDKFSYDTITHGPLIGVMARF